MCSNFLTGKQPKPKPKTIKRTIAIACQILPSARLNQELNAGKHMTTSDCLDPSRLFQNQEDEELSNLINVRSIHVVCQKDRSYHDESVNQRIRRVRTGTLESAKL